MGRFLNRQKGLALLVLVLMVAAPALAQDAAAVATPPATTIPADPRLPVNSLSVIAGVYNTSFWARSFNANAVGFEPNFVLGLISARDILVTSWGLRIGHESGIALRFGADFSIEMWRGVTISFSARLIGGRVVQAKIVLGLSTVTNPIGVEVEREAAVENGDMNRLVYLGSQIATYWERLPYAEAIYRLHHRSGALGFWGNLPDGHNAPTVGFTIRY